MQPPERSSLRQLAAAAGLSSRRFIADATGRVSMAEACGTVGTAPASPPTWLPGRLPVVPAETFRACSVMVSSARQLPAVLALLRLDGIAGRIVLCPPDAAPDHLPAVIAEARISAIISDGTGPALPAGTPVFGCPADAPPDLTDDAVGAATQWLLFTSGTTGRPKLVVHTLPSLIGPLDDGLGLAPDAIWSTFYDVRRYGGLTILLRALLGGGSMVLSRADEPAADFLARAGRSGVTHISGTPTHWRRALMSGAAARMAPRYVRLSGEVADQAILNQLAAAFPAAEVAHAFASTEAGVAFDVRDGLAGFPAGLIGKPGMKAELKVVDGSLRIRSARTADRYLGATSSMTDADGFVDTGDMLELRGDRYHFVGRREGVINVGGQKVHPEEVEAVLNRHPAVQMARVRGRASPVTGALVMAEIVLRASAGAEPSPILPDALRDDILEACRRALPPHKVPVTLRRVASLDTTGSSGKLSRRTQDEHA
ncbi:MAG: AMP-binding protein [Xanthobacteraceae bacterium]|nr:AMP-binding protein [Xanthobacteraceae bacterium]